MNQLESNNTSNEFMKVIDICRNVFIDKYMEYGASWRFFRPESVTDQIYIKLLRIRSIEEKRQQKIDDSIDSEWIGVINYSLIRIMLAQEKKININTDQPIDTVLKQYDKIANQAHELMIRKNHDYNEAWRKLRTTSITDLSLVKISRIIQIEKNESNPDREQAIISNIMDIINYAIFASILLKNK